MSDKTELDRALADLAKADAALNAAEGTIAELRKTVAAKDVELTLAVKDRDVTKALLDREVTKNEDPEEAILKMMPEPAQKMFLAQKANSERLAKRLAEEDDTAAVLAIEKKFAASYSALPVPASEMAPIIKAITGVVTSAQMDTLNAVFTSASKAMVLLTKMQGRLQGEAPTSTEQGVEKKARAMALDKGITFEKAYAEILKADPSLYTQIQIESAATVQ